MAAGILKSCHRKRRGSTELLGPLPVPMVAIELPATPFPWRALGTSGAKVYEEAIKYATAPRSILGFEWR